MKRIIIISLFVLMVLTDAAWGAEKQVVGWIENVAVFPGDLKIKAKLDTGAKNSSLHATQIHEFKRDGQNWVRFELTNWQAQTKTFEALVIRTAKIKQHQSKSEKRQVVQLGICLGNVYKEVEVNLVDRSNYNYQMLIGRSFLKGSFIIDSEQKFTVKPKCRGTWDQ